MHSVTQRTNQFSKVTLTAVFAEGTTIRAGQVSLAVVSSLLWLGLVSPALAQLPAPELHSLSQPLAHIGSSLDLQFAGASTQELAQLRFSSPHVSSQPVLEAALPLGDPPLNSGTFKLTIDSAASPGKCEVRAVGRSGISNPRSLWLTRKPVMVASADHTDAALAIEVSPDNILTAHCVPQRRNYYRCALAAGQSINATVYAKQLDSRATPIVVLYGPAPARRELSRGRAIGDWPAELSCSVDEAGEVLLVVYDAIFGGGPDYSYALEYSLGQGPDAPLEGQSDSASGSELNQLLRPGLTSTAQTVTDVERWTAPTQTFDETTQAASGEVQLPLHATGIFAADSTANTHDFSAIKGQALWVEVDSQRQGQLTDPHLLLYRLTTNGDNPADKQAATESLQQLLEFEDPPVLGDAGLKVVLRDPQLSWTAPEDGRYRIQLLDNESGSRLAEQRGYQLRVEPSAPSLQLLAYPLYPINNLALSRPGGINLMRGGTCSLRVLALRRGTLDTPIEIEVTGLPEGISCLPAVIHPSQSEVSLTLHCSDTAPGWTGPIQIVGRIAADETAPVTAQSATIVWPAIATRNAVQSRLDDELVLCVNAHDTAPVTIGLGEGATLEVKQGEKLSLPIQVTRRAGGAAPCVLRPQNLPPKTSLPEVTVPADQTTGTAELTVAADAPLGEFTCWLQCESKVKWRDNPQALERAEAHLQRLTAALAQATDDAEKKSLQTTIENVTARVATLKQTTAEKELTVWLPSTTQRIRVVGK